MNDVMRIVLGETAMAASGTDDVLASRLIHHAQGEPGWYLYAPTCELAEAEVEAERARPVTAEHLAGGATRWSPCPTPARHGN